MLVPRSKLKSISPETGSKERSGGPRARFVTSIVNGVCWPFESKVTCQSPETTATWTATPCSLFSALSMSEADASWASGSVTSAVLLP